MIQKFTLKLPHDKNVYIGEMIVESDIYVEACRKKLLDEISLTTIT